MNDITIIKLLVNKNMIRETAEVRKGTEIIGNSVWKDYFTVHHDTTRLDDNLNFRK